MLKEAKVVIENWRREYNTVRPHSSLNDRPPAPEDRLPPWVKRNSYRGAGPADLGTPWLEAFNLAVRCVEVGDDPIGVGPRCFLSWLGISFTSGHSSYKHASCRKCQGVTVKQPQPLSLQR
jgi:hypothetical protein